MIKRGLRSITSLVSRLGDLPFLMGDWLRYRAGRPLRHAGRALASAFAPLFELVFKLRNLAEHLCLRPLRRALGAIATWIEACAAWPRSLLARAGRAVGRGMRRSLAMVGAALRPVVAPIGNAIRALGDWLDRRFGRFFRWCEAWLRPVIAPFQAAGDALRAWGQRLVARLARANLKRLLWITATTVVVLGVLGYWQGRPLYRKHKERSFLNMARLFAAKGEDMKAVICARNAFYYNPSNAEACLLLGDLADRARSPQAIIWRKRLVEIAPTMENRVRLVDSALRYDAPPYPVAATALEEFLPVDRNQATYHLLTARLALQLKQFNRAEAAFEQAIKLDPTNALHRLNLAVLRLGSTNTALAQAARRTLEDMRDHPQLGSEALRSLANERMSRTNLAEARAYSEALQRRDDCSLADRLTHLSILHGLRSPDLDARLREVQAQCATNAAHAGELGLWMLGHRRAREAMTWMNSLAPDLRLRQPVPATIAACYEALGDWHGLQVFLEKANWGDRDFLKSALLARALRQQAERTAADSYWREAMRLASARAELLALLAQTTRKWGWTNETLEVLNQLSTRFTAQPWAMQYVFQQYYAMGNTQAMSQVLSGLLNPDPSDTNAPVIAATLTAMSARFAAQPWAVWVLQHLFDHYVNTGNTPGLYQILSMALTRDSENTVLKNNLATVSLLLRTNLPAAHQLAGQAYQREPANPAVASTHAFSLHVQGKTAEGVAVMDKLKPAELRQPSLAAYYGVLLTSAGQWAKARQYLALAESPRLLPEERALVAEARRKAEASAAGP